MNISLKFGDYGRKIRFQPLIILGLLRCIPSGELENIRLYSNELVILQKFIFRLLDF